MERLNFPPNSPHELSHMEIWNVDEFNTHFSETDDEMPVYLSNEQKVSFQIQESLTSLIKYKHIVTQHGFNIDPIIQEALYQNIVKEMENVGWSTESFDSLLRPSASDGINTIRNHAHLLWEFIFHINHGTYAGSKYAEVYQKGIDAPVMLLLFKQIDNVFVLHYWSRTFAPLFQHYAQYQRGIGGFVLSFILSQYPAVGFVFLTALAPTRKLLHNMNVKLMDFTEEFVENGHLYNLATKYGQDVILRDNLVLLKESWKKLLLPESSESNQKKQKMCVECLEQPAMYKLEANHRHVFCGQKCAEIYFSDIFAL
jgi:hypothetical protein